MKISYYFYIFIIITLFLAFIFFPQNTELVYVYQKSGDYKKLADIYKRTLKIHYSKDIHKKYIDTLFKLNSPNLLKEVEKFISKYNDTKLLNKAINYTISKEDFKNYTKLLSKGFQLTEDIKYLQKLIDYYSYTHNRKELIATLKKAYLLTKNKKYLKTLFGIGEKEYVINEYLKNINSLSEKDINLVLSYYSEKKEYDKYLKVLDKIYKKTNDISFLIKKKNILSFLHRKKELIEVIKELYYKTKDIKYLDTLYTLNEKKFCILEYEKRINTLSKTELRQLYKYYLWGGYFKKVVNLMKNYIGIENLTPEEEKEYTALLTFYAKDAELIDFYKKRFKLTDNVKYLVKLAEIYDYYGYPYKAAKNYIKAFKITGEENYLNKAISIYLALSDYNNFLKYSLLKLEKFYSEKLLKQTVGLLIELNNFNKAINLTKKYLKIDNNLFHYLATLYFSIGESNKALQLYLNNPPEKLTNSELSYISTLKKIKEQFIPYILAYYKRTKERFFLNRVLKYYANKMAFYKFNRIFKKYYGKINEKNYLTYFELIPEKFKKFKINEAKRLIKASFNVKLINNLCIYLMGFNEQIDAIKGFKKVLYLDNNNLTALEQLGKIYYWQKNFSKALKSFFLYDKIKSDNPVIKFYIGDILYNKKQHKKAEKYFLYVINNIKKDSLENKMIYLKSYVYLYGINNVLNEYREVVKESNFDRDVYADFIDALYFSKRYDILKEEYEKFKKMPSKYTSFVRLLRLFANVQIDLKNFHEAKKLLDKALAIIKKNKVKNSTIYSDYGYLYYAQNKRVKSLKYYKKAYRVDKKNDDLLRVIKELQDFLHRNIVVSYSIKNKVKEESAEINIPFKDKYWAGFSYKIFQHKKSEIYFKFQDINKTKYLFELGKNHLNITIGDNTKLYLRYKLYTDYKASVDEKMKVVKTGISLDKTFIKLNNIGINLNLSKNLYRNEHGNVAATLNFDATVSYPLKDNLYLSSGFSYVKMNYYNSDKSQVFFDDYRAINLFITKNYGKDNRKLNWDLSFGTIYDLISSKYNYSGTLNINYNKNVNFEYNLYYDTFSREQVEMWQFNWRIKF